MTQPGTSAEEMQRTTLAVSKELRAIPGVRNFGAHIGQAFLGEEVAGVNLGENWVSIDPSVDYDATLDKIEDVNDAYAGLFRETQTYLDERIEEVISGGKEPIVVRVYGQNLSVLREKADEIEKIMGTIEGVQDQHTDISTDVPQLQVEVNLAKAEKYGLKPGDVRRAAATLVAGEEVGDIFRSGKAYDVWSGAHRRRAPASPTSRTCALTRHRARPSGSLTWQRCHCSRVRMPLIAKATPAGWTSARPSRATSAVSWGSSKTSSRTCSSIRAITLKSSASGRSGSQRSAHYW